VKIPEAAFNVILPDETDAASVNLVAPLYRYTDDKVSSADTPILCNVRFVTTAGAADLLMNVNSAKFAAACPATKAEATGEVADKETAKSVPEITTPGTTDDEPEAIALVLGPKYPTAGVIPFDNWNFITAAFVKEPKYPVAGEIPSMFCNAVTSAPLDPTVRSLAKAVDETTGVVAIEAAKLAACVAFIIPAPKSIDISAAVKADAVLAPTNESTNANDAMIPINFLLISNL